MPSRPHRALLIGLNYPPEPTGVAPYAGALARGLAHRGIETRTITAHPHYPAWKVAAGYGQWSLCEQIDGVEVVRVRHYVPRVPSGLRRVLSEISFGLRTVTARWGSPDVIIAVSPALLSTGLALIRATVAHYRTPTVVWVQDLYSLGLSETGHTAGLLLRAMGALEGWVLRRATRVVVIHDRFANRVAEDFGIPRERIDVVRNWTHLAPSAAVDVGRTRVTLGWRDDETVVVHAGNMGVKQGLQNVIEAARLADTRRVPVRFVMLGGGAEREKLRALAQGVARVEFLDPLPDAAYAAAIQSADLLLVNEKPGVAEMAVPSKLTSYFDSGRPVLAATDLTGITAEEVRAAGAGVIVPAGDPVALLDAAVTLSLDPEACARMGANGKRYRETVLDEDVAMREFRRILLSLLVECTGSEPAHVRKAARSRS